MVAHDCYETDEARDIRESYNARNATGVFGEGFSSTAESRSQNLATMPCPAGVAQVDLEKVQELQKNIRDGSPGGTRHSEATNEASVIRKQANFAGGEKSLAGRVRSKWRNGTKGILSEKRVVRRLGGGLRRSPKLDDLAEPTGGLHSRERSMLGRRRRQKSGESDGGESDDTESRKQRDEDILTAAVAAELLQLELPPRRAAEEAKAAATRSAQNCADQVTREQETRVFWRVAMGNAPGLKAELAKLHATEQARLALKEFEIARARSVGSSGMNLLSSQQLPLTTNGTPAHGHGHGHAKTHVHVHVGSGVGTTPLSAQLNISSTFAEVKVPRGALHEASHWKDPAYGTRAQTDRITISSPTLSVDADGSNSASHRKPTSSGVLGWVWSQLSSTRTESRPRIKGVDGPLTA